MSFIDHVIYASAWVLFALLHSLTAGAGPRHSLGRVFGRGHRLAFNVLSVIEVLALFAVGGWLARHARTFHLPLAVRIIKVFMLVAGAWLMLAAMRLWRPGLFMGWAQWRGEEDTAQTLATGGLYGWVRHPLYSASLLLFWGIVWNELTLATAVWGSLYLFFGSMIEERRLTTLYGDIYRRYAASTGRFVPRLIARQRHDIEWKVKGEKRTYSDVKQARIADDRADL